MSNENRETGETLYREMITEKENKQGMFGLKERRSILKGAGGIPGGFWVGGKALKQ